MSHGDKPGSSTPRTDELAAINAGEEPVDPEEARDFWASEFIAMRELARTLERPIAEALTASANARHDACDTPSEVVELIERLRQVRKTNPFAGHAHLCEYAADVLERISTRSAIEPRKP